MPSFLCACCCCSSRSSTVEWSASDLLLLILVACRMHLHQSAIEIHLCQHQTQSHLFFFSFSKIGIADYNNFCRRWKIKLAHCSCIDFRKNLKTNICKSYVLLLTCNFERRRIRIPNGIIPILLKFLLLQFGTATVCIESRGRNHVKTECNNTITRLLLDLKPPCNLKPHCYHP